jgi:hypothetical protein
MLAFMIFHAGFIAIKDGVALFAMKIDIYKHPTSSARHHDIWQLFF